MPDLSKLIESTHNVMENQERFDKFTNGCPEGFYVTNLDPSKEVETLPHYMDRIRDRFLTVVWKGIWQPDTQYAANDIVRDPGADGWWLVIDPYTSGDDFMREVADRRLMPYAANLIPEDTNTRQLWVADRDYGEGEEITLPLLYFPGRHSMMLFFQAVMCAPREADVPNTAEYQYTEVGDDQNVLSDRVILNFDVERGAILDQIVLTTAINRHLDEIRLLAGQAESDRARAETAADKAEESETAAKDSADAAKESEDEAKASQEAAAGSATDAAGSASTAGTKAGEADESAAAAALSATDAAGSAGTAGTKAGEAAQSKTAAETAAANAGTSETNAKNSEDAAADSARAASDSADAASLSEQHANDHKDDAYTYQTNASESADAANASKETAAEKAGEAAASATTAAGADTAATTKAAEALASRNAAETARTAAEAAAGIATAKAGAAASDAEAAETAAEAAEEAAEEAADALAQVNAAIGSALEAAVDPSDLVLKVENDKFRSEIGISHDPATGILSLTGKDGATIGSVNLPLDKFLKSALVVTDPEGQPAGRYIELVFVTDDGDSPQYIDVTTIAKAYSAGNGIAIDANNAISVKPKAGSGLEATADGFGPDGTHKIPTTDQLAKLDGLSATPALTVARGQYKAASALASGANITVGSYVVGSNKLMVWFDGVFCDLGSDNQYTEVGTAGASSTTIKIGFDVPAGSVISYRILG
jgi:hypothetical protein